MGFNVKFAATSGNIKAKFEGPEQTMVLKNQVGYGRRIDALGDVDTSVSQANGSILVYDADSDTYVQRDVLTFDTESGAFKLDGGEGGF